MNMVSISLQQPSIEETVREGFSKSPKRLPSWLLYDEAGAKLFQAIMQMPGYYLTSCEHEILNSYKEEFRKYFYADEKPFHLIELGAGDGVKTEILLKHFAKQHTMLWYTPVDVSETALDQLQQRLQRSVPTLPVTPLHKRYEEAFAEFVHIVEERKVFMFMGANIGNFTPDEALAFVKNISASMQGEDMLMVGFDLKKDPRLIQAAYDDPFGITRKFNMNLLVRLNRELGAQFNLNKFDHYPFYDPLTGIAKSYLISLADQNVFIESLNSSVSFRQWEVIHTETSLKYDEYMIADLAKKAGLTIVDYFYDQRKYFCDVLFKK